MQIVINNTLVTYSDTGQGKVLLCLHGWMHDNTSFDQLTIELKANFRIIALDLPNFGSSQVTESIVSIDDYANFLGAFVKKLELKDYVLVGHSMGCQIALHAVGNEILTPTKLVLLAPAGVRTKGVSYKKLLKIPAKILSPVISKQSKKRFYRLIGSDYTPDLSSVHKNIIAKVLSTDIQDDAIKVSISTLIVNGTKDAQTPLWMAQILAKRISGAKLEVIEGEQHWLHQKSPQKVAELIKSFAK